MFAQEQAVEYGVRFAERFGLEAFLLTAILLGIGFFIWKVGSRLADAIIIAAANLSDSSKITAEVTKDIKNAVDAMNDRTKATNDQLIVMFRENTIAAKHNVKILSTQLTVISILMQYVPDYDPQSKAALQEVYHDLKNEIKSEV